MFRLSFESPTYAGLMAAILEAAGTAVTITGSNGPITTDNHGGDPDGGPANPNAPAVDNVGLPWDERIHSATKAMNADNTWRKKRGVSAALVGTIEQELRARGNVQQQFGNGQQQQFQPNVQQFQPNTGQPNQAFNPNVQQFQPNTGNGQVQQFDPNAGNVQQQQFQPNTGQPNQAFNPNAGNVQQQQPAAIDFGAFMQMISQLMTTATITNVDIGNICQQLGIQNIALLQNDPVRTQQAVALLRQWGKIQ